MLIKNAISTTLSYLFLSLLTSSICLFYMTTLKLNKYIKIILCSLALVNITTILLSIISNVLIILFSQRTFFSCLILNQVTYVIVYENISAVSLISVLRYTMAYHASRFKITSTRWLSAVGFNYKLGYKPCDLLWIWFLSLVEIRLALLCYCQFNRIVLFQ